MRHFCWLPPLSEVMVEEWCPLIPSWRILWAVAVDSLGALMKPAVANDLSAVRVILVWTERAGKIPSRFRSSVSMAIPALMAAAGLGKAAGF